MRYMIAFGGLNCAPKIYKNCQHHVFTMQIKALTLDPTLNLRASISAFTDSVSNPCVVRPPRTACSTFPQAAGRRTITRIHHSQSPQTFLHTACVVFLTSVL